MNSVNIQINLRINVLPKSEHGKPAINSGYDTMGGGASCPQCPMGLNGETSEIYGGSVCCIIMNNKLIFWLIN